ncbi:hypothetical protein BKA67DRAFT_671150 [Truncatella angustata]|uniref:Uncharacterized protein n=1 Tax=Truncatella angustata TaxID=152316 RepID=A0A9P8RKA5_9PEZI|nr:uncharacterized protein BKA67DRAFT_671150 [Truncatella angustata]KAH6643474.1 hypothetical protein BKA67DRAFT_671150 [Truncatella angustata]
MASFKAYTINLTFMLAFFASPILAVPRNNVNTMKVFVRTDDFAYVESPELATAIAVEQAALPVEKRSHIQVQACTNADCTSCRTVLNADFSGNTGCLSAQSTACLIISDITSAQVWYWNNNNCNGNLSKFQGCPSGSTNVASPGTNSIGIHTGCN